MSSSGSILKGLGVEPKSANEINPAENLNVVLNSENTLSNEVQAESKDEFSYYFINKLLKAKEEKGEVPSIILMNILLSLRAILKIIFSLFEIITQKLISCLIVVFKKSLLIEQEFYFLFMG